MSALAGWSTDIKAAPHGRYVVKQRREGVDQRVFVPERVILTTKCGKVTLSHYLPEEKRWLMLGKGEAPVAWTAWPEPFNSQAKASDDNGRISATEGAPVTGEASRASVGAGTDAEFPHLPSGAAACAADSPARSNSSPISSGTNPRSDGDAFVAVKGKARLTNADSVEPSPSDTHQDASVGAA